MTRNSHCDIIEKEIQTLIEKAGDYSKNDFAKWEKFSFLLYNLLDQYRSEKLKQDPRNVDCKEGCSYCCYHWVEDVYFFESIAIVSAIFRTFPDRVDEIREKAKKDETAFRVLCDKSGDCDEIELLQKFYSLQSACPLLAENGTCSLYDVRPITCRSFFSVDAERYCKPFSGNEKDSGTYMVLPPPHIEDKLDHLHLAVSENYPTSLRAMLAFML